MGPPESTLTLKQVAKLFDYEEKTWRQLVRDGHVLEPRGFGQSEFYTGLDVAIIIEVMGRWGPQRQPLEPSPQTAESRPKVPKSGRKPPESAESGVTEDEG